MIFPGIKLTVFYEDDFDGEEIESDKPVSGLNKREITFYDVGAIGTYLDDKDDDRPYGLIYLSGGSSFLSVLSPEELETKVNSHIRNTSLTLFAKGQQ